MTSDQLNDLKQRTEALNQYLKIEEKRAQIAQDEKQTGDPDFWQDPQRAENIMRKIKSSKVWVDAVGAIQTNIEEIEVLGEFLEAGEASAEEIDALYEQTIVLLEDLEFRSTLSAEEDELSCTLQINAGAGGTEACDWAAMLHRMYTMWAEKEGYKLTTLNYQDGDVAGIKSAEIEIEGAYAFGMLKGENGVHRLVRVSPYNAQGKRMTSFASVFVHPSVNEDIEVDINTADLEWDTFRSSGAGGQHVNKTDSAVRVRHLPSGVVVECQAQRSQHQNREKALQMLKSRLYEIELEKQRAAKNEIEAGKMKNEWGSQIRSYVLDDRRVKDHRTNFETRQPEKVLDGDLGDFIKHFLLWLNSTE